MTTRYRRDLAAAGGKAGLFWKLLADAQEHAAHCPSCRAATQADVDETAVVTDGVHLMALDLRHLHRFAARLGLRREWFQAPGINVQRSTSPHYDLTTTSALHRACLAGAHYVHWRTFATQTRDWFRDLP